MDGVSENDTQQQQGTNDASLTLRSEIKQPPTAAEDAEQKPSGAQKKEEKSGSRKSDDDLIKELKQEIQELISKPTFEIQNRTDLNWHFSSSVKMKAEGNIITHAGKDSFDSGIILLPISEVS